MKFKSKMPLKLDPGTIRFIKEFEDMIDANDFKSLYAHAWSLGANLNELGRMFYDSDIDPLEYMTEVPEQFFADNHDLLEISIPEGITRLCDSCFYDCINVKEIIVPRSVKQIDEWALAGLDNVKEITIEGKLESLHPFGIYELPSLERIYSIPENKEILTMNVSELKENASGLVQARFMEI